MRARGRTDVEWLDNEEDVRRRAPHLKNADIKVSQLLSLYRKFKVVVADRST